MKNLIDEIKKLQIENKKLRSQIKKIREIVNGKVNTKPGGSRAGDGFKMQNSGIAEDITKQ